MQILFFSFLSAVVFPHGLISSALVCVDVWKKKEKKRKWKQVASSEHNAFSRIRNQDKKPSYSSLDIRKIEKQAPTHKKAGGNNLWRLSRNEETDSRLLQRQQKKHRHLKDFWQASPSPPPPPIFIQTHAERRKKRLSYKSGKLKFNSVIHVQ